MKWDIVTDKNYCRKQLRSKAKLLTTFLPEQAVSYTMEYASNNQQNLIFAFISIMTGRMGNSFPL